MSANERASDPDDRAEAPRSTDGVTDALRARFDVDTLDGLSPTMADRAHVTKHVGAPGSGKTGALLDAFELERERYGTAFGDLLFCTYTRSGKADAVDAIRDRFPSADPDDLTARVRTVNAASLIACYRAEDGFDTRDYSETEEAAIDEALANHTEKIAFDYDAPAGGKGKGATDVDGDDRGGRASRPTPDSAAGKWYILERNTMVGGELSLDAKYATHFFKTHFPGIEFDPRASDPLQQHEEGRRTETPVGNQILAVYDYVRARNWDFDDFHRASVADGIPAKPTTLKRVMVEWASYKFRHKLVEHTDYVHRALAMGHPPPCRVLFIDEFQDLSPIQYDLYRFWRDSGALDRVYIGGDRHQSIYSFRGGSPRPFAETPAHVETRQEASWRCAPTIVGKAVSVAQGPAEHDVRHVRSHPDRRGGDGVAADVHVSTDGELGDLVEHHLREPARSENQQGADVFLLARTNQQVKTFTRGLQKAGIPYIGIKEETFDEWADPMPTLLRALDKFDADERLATPSLRALLTNAKPHPARESVQDAATDGRLPAFREHDVFHTFTSETYRQWFPDVESAVALARTLTFPDYGHVGFRRDLLANALERGAGNRPAAVRVGTIHSAKGLEAPTVLVSPAYPARQRQRFVEDPDIEAEERRLYYVALTRAKQNIYITHDYHGGDEFPPLAQD